MLRYCIAALLVAVVVASKTKATTTRATTRLPDAPTANPNDASAYCFQCRSRRNHKDLYADPADCHNYYQCFYVNETFALGIQRKCPQGQFWHDAVLTCMPEGATPCLDACLTNSNKCYAGAGCRQFFVCSNTGSFGMCCPSGTQFNVATCSCDESTTCNDACVQAGPAIATSVAPATQFNATVCRDSFGAFVSTVSGEANAYIQIDNEGQATEKLYCPVGVSFDLTACRCDIENGATVPPTQTNRKASFYMNFNPPTARKDLSINNNAVEFLNGADVTSTISFRSANGGSLNIPSDNAYVSVPAFKNFDFRNAGSWCAAFRCDSQTNNQCNFNGGILSNNKDASSSEFTFVYGVQANNAFTAKLSFWSPVNTLTLTGSFSVAADGWNSFCVTYDGTAARLYLNGAVADTEFVGSYFSIAHCPLAIGNDQSLGSFLGKIDSVFVSTFALDATTVANYHSSASAALAQYL